MRVVLDLQSLFAPTTARRGIGFYSLELAQAMCRAARGHDVHLLLTNPGDDAAVVAVREAFRGLVSHRSVHVLEPVREAGVPVADRRAAGAANEVLRESVLAALRPEAVLVTSLFELGADFPTTVDRWSSGPPTAVVLYDLMPLEEPDVLLADPGVQARYRRTLEDLQRAAVLLAISDHSRERAQALLDPCPPTRTIYGAAIPGQAEGRGGPPPGLDGRAMVLCVGGDHPRKNMEGLVRAWARVPAALREGRALVLACEISAGTSATLQRAAREDGLAPSEVIITGFVSAADLSWMYDAAELFVFPSFSEGLGLPALEAMQHGCPVLVADATSLKELVLDPQARFDPADPTAMAACIGRALSDPVLLERLRAQSTQQSEVFTWERSAEQAWEGLEAVARPPAAGPVGARRSLAVVSPWPPVRSGVADYAAATTAALREHYEVTIVGDASASLGVHVLDREQFRRTWYQYDRILYHIGNSPHHVADMVALPDAPGHVVLHDSTLGGTLRFVGEALGHPAGVEAMLRESSPRQHTGAGTDQRGLRTILSGAVGVQVHSPHAAAEVARAGFFHSPVHVVPLPALHAVAAPAAPRTETERLLVGHFGFVQAFKQPELLLEAASLAARRLGRDLEVVFVGSVSDAYEAVLRTLAARHNIAVRFLGYVGEEELVAWTATVHCAVQLRSVSHGESSGSVTQLLAAARPTVVSDIGSFSDLPREVVRHHPPGGSAQLLAQTLVECLTPDIARAMGERAAAYAREKLTLANYANGTVQALERVYEDNPAVRGASAMREATAGASPALMDQVLRAVTSAVVKRSGAPMLLASDVSVLAVTPFLTGIQRVTLSLHRELGSLLSSRGAGLVAADVAPATVPRVPHQAIAADPVLAGVEVRVDECDWLLCLDLDFQLSAVEPALLAAKARGTRILVNVYDLLIVTNPEWFVPRAGETVFLPWLHTVVRLADVVMVNSRVTAEVLRAWVADHEPERVGVLQVAVLPLGVDVPEPEQRRQRPRAAAPRFTIVGTIEPRKGHDDVLDAADRLWAAGLDFELTIVGRQGWLVEGLIERLSSHGELGRRLSWLAAADDDDLHRVLTNTDCMLVASRGEGFGLPVIEAAAHGIPLVVRDIPVFREVAGDGATYFSGGGAELAEVLTDWTARWRAGEHLAAGAVAMHSWAEVAELLVRVLDAQDG